MEKSVHATVDKGDNMIYMFACILKMEGETYLLFLSFLSKATCGNQDRYNIVIIKQNKVKGYNP